VGVISVIWAYFLQTFAQLDVFGLRTEFVSRHVRKKTCKEGAVVSNLLYSGRLKMRDWNYQHHQKCRGGKCRTGNIGTMLQGVENAGPSSYGKPNTYLLRHTQHDLSNVLFVVCCIILCKCQLILWQCCGLQYVKQNTHISYGTSNTVKTRALNQEEVNENLLLVMSHIIRENECIVRNTKSFIRLHCDRA